MLCKFSSTVLVFLSFVLLSFFFSTFVSSAFAAGDAISAGTLTLSPTFKSIGIELKFIDDDNRDATASMEFKKSSELTWRPGLDLWRTDPADASTPVDTLGRAFYGAALQLDANTSYDIKITVMDPDGGGTTVTGTVSTRVDAIPAANTLTPTHFIRMDGNNSNTGTSDSPSGAWRTLQKAVLAAPSGAVVQVGPGYYIQAPTLRVNPITFIAQYPAVDDNRSVINPGLHSVIEPGNTTTGLSNVSCPLSANDCDYKGVWQQVTGLSAPGLAGDNIATGSALPESVDPNIKIWKWENAPVTSAFLMSYAASRSAEPQRVTHWAIPATASINTPEGFIEKLITNKTYSYGFSTFNSGKDIYLRLPPNAPSDDPNQLYITVGSNNGTKTGLNLRGSDSRISGFEVRTFLDGLTITASGAGSVVDHNFAVANRGGIYFQAFSPGTYGKDAVVQYNLIKDSNLWTNDPTNNPAIPWQFIKQATITNADDSLYSIKKPGQYSESGAVGGRGGALNTVIRYNTFEGTFNGVYPGWQPGFDRYAGSNMDVYDNLFQHMSDDALEPEDQSINFKAWNNRMNETLTFLSVGPVKFGPLYLFKNTTYRISSAGVGLTNNGLSTAGTHFKYSGNSVPAAKVYVVNNTFWNDQGATAGGGQYASGNIAGERFFMRNNLFRTTQYAFDIAANSRDGAKMWNEDYNYFYTSDLTRGFKWNNSVAGVGNLTNYRSTTGQGVHTNLADTDSSLHTSPDSWLNDPTAGDLTLHSTNAADTLVDKGTIVPSISDPVTGFTGCAPDLGSSELAYSIVCLRNRGFEESNTWGWTIFSSYANNLKIDNVLVRSGQKSLHFTGTHSGPYSYQDASTIEGKTYTLSGWIHIPVWNNGMSVTVNIQPAATINNNYTPIGNVINAANVTAQTSDWVYFSKTVTMPAGSTKMRVAIKAPNLNGEAYVDDIVLSSIVE